MKHVNGASAGSDSIEKLVLGVLERFQAEGISLPKDFLSECLLDSFRECVAGSDVETIGLPGEIAVVFFDDRRNELRARFQRGIDSAYTTWEKACRANRGTAH